MPVVYQNFESSESEYAFIQADNAIALWAELDLAGINADIGDLGPDFDINMLGIQDFEIDPADKYEGKDADEVPDEVEPIAKLGQIYKLGEHRLMCGDSTVPDTISNLFNGEKAELCFTSPPYSDQRDYNGGKDLSTQKLAQFITAAKDSCEYFAVNLGYQRKDGEVYPYWDDYIKEANAGGLKLLSWNVWNKGECGSIGNQSAMFGISHEWIFVFGKETKDLNRTVENKSAGSKANHTGNRQSDGTIKKSKDRIVNSHSQLKTVYDCVPQKARDDIDHPARFPVDFPIGYIEAMTTSNQSVYEPFGGSGSTLIACEKTNRKCFMMELDPHYVDVIIARWEKFTGKKAELLNG
jgi:DNA modification methylase